MSENQFKTVFIFLDTDKNASPFDILTTIDALPDAEILKYENVTVEDAERIVYDAMFPRGPEGAKHTKIFINGRNLELANQILEKIRNCMFAPFELSVIIDPRGAYSTASAAVAKTLEVSLSKGFGGLDSKTVVVLAGTGPVGQTAARLYISEKAHVVVTSRDLRRSSAVAAKINEEYGVNKAVGIETKTTDDVGKAIEGAEVVLSAGAAGITLLPLNVLKKTGTVRIVADINAIPPLGVEGLKSKAEGEEFLPAVFGIGALAIGKLKNAVEVVLIRRVAAEPKGLFDYRIGYELAKRLVSERLEVAKQSMAGGSKQWLS
jgi:hypothetical protein